MITKGGSNGEKMLLYNSLPREIPKSKVQKSERRTGRLISTDCFDCFDCSLIKKSAKGHVVMMGRCC